MEEPAFDVPRPAVSHRSTARFVAQCAERFAARRWVGAFGALFAAYLMLGSLIVAFVSYVDHPGWLTVTTMIAAAGCLLLPGLPTLGAGLVTVLWSVGPLVQTAVGSDQYMPPNLEYAALFAATVAAYYGTRRYLPLLAVAFGTYIYGMVSAIGASEVPFDTLNTVAEAAVRFALATVAGYALREQWRTQATKAALERSRMMLERHRAQQTLATGIHDGISNKLAFLLMTLDRHIDANEPVSGKELRRMRDCADEAYASSHNLIRMLSSDSTGTNGTDNVGDTFAASQTTDTPKSPTSSTQTASTANVISATRDTHEDTRPTIFSYTTREDAITSPDSTGYRWINTIADSLRRYDEQLSEAGFDGAGLPPTPASAPPAISRAVLDATLELIGELYANVVKYADSARPYIVAVNATADHIVVTCADTAADQSTSDGNDSDANAGEHATAAVRDMLSNTRHRESGTGTGLARRRAQIERLGGTLTVTADGNAWHCEAIIPYMTAQ
ncbi:hypothetical protein [Bifidobacterium sp. SO1]|uniref:hypothetical protein n=1 Tax=Bifidobacterium sp. SO1 TaxID=2809029 RepID=UPI001BDD05C2|nr:hypothetical protein [Bifidobacterium sp. SO1]MBT1160999.1 histidine kinase dimerization/phosphoacceptor domain-containing protein [Bifidobacterium sp. SO1]